MAGPSLRRLFRALGRVAMLIATLFSTLLVATTASAQIDVDRVKLSYTQYFIGLVHWDSRNGREIVFCSFADSRLGRQMLETLDNKSIAAFTIVTRGLSLNNPQLTGCDALFIPESLAAYAPALLARAGNLPVLTISDMEGFVQRGGVIGFIIDGDKLRFDIGMQAAAGRGINLSAKLLELARQVSR